MNKFWSFLLIIVLAVQSPHWALAQEGPVPSSNCANISDKSKRDICIEKYTSELNKTLTTKDEALGTTQDVVKKMNYTLSIIGLIQWVAMEALEWYYGSTCLSLSNKLMSFASLSGALGSVSVFIHKLVTDIQLEKQFIELKNRTDLQNSTIQRDTLEYLEIRSIFQFYKLLF